LHLTTTAKVPLRVDLHEGGGWWWLMSGVAKAPGPMICAPDAPDFKNHIPELLKSGGIEDSPVARNRLGVELTLAWAEGDQRLELQQKQPSPDLFKQLTTSISKTQGLLRRLEEFPGWESVACEYCPVGEGTISIQSGEKLISGETLGLPKNPPPLDSWPERVPPGGSLALINRQRVLDRLRREIARKRPNRRRGNQKEVDKALIVARAVSFFQQHSPVQATTHFDGPCVKFCKRFYEVVTGVRLGPSGLERQIRRELRRPKSENPNIEKA
jgi:hypothetical protein